MFDIVEKGVSKEMVDQDAVIIYQRGFGVIDSTALHKKIGTIGLGPCISVVIYDKIKKILALAHFDSMTELEGSISTIMSWLNFAGVEDIGKLESILDGGDDTSRELRIRLKELLTQWKITNVTDHNPDSSPNNGQRKFSVSVEDGIPQYGILPGYREDPQLRTAKINRTRSTVKKSLTPDYIDVKGQVIGIDK